jgi:hypothetical protein
MRYWAALLLVATLILSACGGAEPSDQAAAPQQEDEGTASVTEPAEILATATDMPTEVASVTPTTAEQPEPTIGEPEVTDPAPTITPTAEISPTPPEQEAAFNGQFESTYFRGAANAPITIIDYSDFL